MARFNPIGHAAYYCCCWIRPLFCMVEKAYVVILCASWCLHCSNSVEEFNLFCRLISQTETEKENLEKIEDEDEDDDEGGYHQHDDDGHDGEIVQIPNEGYEGVEDSNAQGALS